MIGAFPVADQAVQPKRCGPDGDRAGGGDRSLGHGSAGRYARRLLDALGIDARIDDDADHPALAWRRAGLMDVTGLSDGEGLVCPAALTSAADGCLMALKAIALGAAGLPRNGALLLGERARLMGLLRGGRASANRSCQLLDASDGRIALNLAREEDWDLMPALFETEAVSTWMAVEREVAKSSVASLIERAIEFGLPVALDHPPRASVPLFQKAAAAGPARRAAVPLVIDLSALWAGPLAASLLDMAGAEVVKIESRSRPDGARRGHAGFYDLLNRGKQSVALDFSSRDELALLSRLLDRADIVIESSRPRALRGLGIDRDRFVANGAIWVSITAHDDTDRVGFGDDAAVDAGLAALMSQGWNMPLFAGDAIADPLTGLHAALGAWAAWRNGDARLIALSLSSTVAHAMSAGVALDAELLDWQQLASSDTAPYYPLRRASGAAARSGADNSLLLA